MTMFDDLSNFVNTIRLTLDNHPDVIFIKNLELKYIYVNQSFLDLDSRVDRDYIIGKTSKEIMAVEEERAELFVTTDHKVIREGIVVQYEDTLENKLGVYHALVIKSPIYNNEGEIIGIYGTARDASDLVHARDMVETILNTIPYPVFIKNLDMVYTRVNDAYAKELGIQKSDILGKTDYELFNSKHADFYRQKDNHVIQTGQRALYLSRAAHVDKKFMTIKDPLQDQSGEIIGVVGIINLYLDIEELRDEILNQQKIESLSALAGGIAHDLNNMLTSIVGLSSILVEDLKDPEQRSMIQTMYNSSRNAASLIEKLLTFGKQTPREFGQVDLGLVISDVVDLVRSSYSTQVEIITSFVTDSITISADRTQITQMIMNLIINAVEAMDFKGTIEVSMDISEVDIQKLNFLIVSSNANSGTYVCMTVSDEGPGIDSDLLSKMFDPFYTTKEYGSGLGLSIVYGALTSHDGLLRVDSCEHGTNFEIYLPIE